MINNVCMVHSSNFRGKKFKDGQLKFFAAGISSVVHPVSNKQDFI
jgi:hypothetical protein